MSINKKRIDFWENHVREWKESGLSQAEYARQNDLDEQLFSKWKIRLAKMRNNDDNKLIEIPNLKAKNKSKADEIELCIKGQYKLKIPSLFNADALNKLINILENRT